MRNLTRGSWKMSRRKRRRSFLSPMLHLSITIFLLVHANLMIIGVTGKNDAIDAETGGICVDADPTNCPYWAAVGECQSNRGYMHVHCKKSCNRCNVVRVNDRNEINRYMAQKKQEIQKMRDIRRQQKEALDVLKGEDTPKQSDDHSIQGNYLDPEPNKKHHSQSNTAESNEKIAKASSLPETTDTTRSTTAKDISDRKTTSTHSETMTSSKTKANKKIDAETGMECIDQDAKNCPFWASVGECEANRTWMHRNCKLSCDRCHVVRVQNQNEINQYIAQKKRETAREREERKKAREAVRVLEGGSRMGIGDEL